MQIEQEITDDMIQTIANNAVREAQQKSLENGIPNAYSKNGVDYYQLPDGTITMQNPFAQGELKERLDKLRLLQDNNHQNRTI